ncbi:MAG: hypothetical protein OQK46_06720 [Gammaproteobacteria bacterium]|nr:hypothetical protein [Gammaproteobacteria bacterium]
MSLLKPDLSKINVPEWVRYIAQDSDGSWWGYSVEPLENHRGWYENELGQNIKLTKSAPVKEWRQCLFTHNSK